MFNRIWVEGLTSTWTMHTIVPVHKLGNPLLPENCQTIMIHNQQIVLRILEAKLNIYTEVEEIQAPSQAGCRRAFCTTDHILTLHCLVDQSKAQKKQLYRSFIGLWYVPRKRLRALQFPSNMMWAMYALYAQVSWWIRCPRRWTQAPFVCSKDAHAPILNIINYQPQVVLYHHMYS